MPKVGPVERCAPAPDPFIGLPLVPAYEGNAFGCSMHLAAAPVKHLR
jgi:hypothetical protein